MKAGKIASGDFSVEKAVRSGTAKLVMLDESASENTKKQWRDACSFRNIPLIRIRAMGSVTDIDLPKSNVIALHLADDNAVIIRPSGTEPKIKLYITSVGKDKDNAAEICEKLVVASKEILGVE